MRYVSIDVECVDCRVGQKVEKAVASVAVVDENEEELLNVIVCPDYEIVDYITEITGFEPGDLDDGISFAELRTELRSILGPDVCIVGQSVDNDIKWLKLVKGHDYNYYIDLANEFATTTRNGKVIRRKLSEEVECLLGETISYPHYAIVDAYYSMRLFNEFLKHLIHKKKVIIDKALKNARHHVHQRRPLDSLVSVTPHIAENVTVPTYRTTTRGVQVTSSTHVSYHSRRVNHMSNTITTTSTNSNNTTSGHRNIHVPQRDNRQPYHYYEDSSNTPYDDRNYNNHYYYDSDSDYYDDDDDGKCYYSSDIEADSLNYHRCEEWEIYSNNS